jgi:NAD(P)-dependent dehydrogenase (short-subunit alcohol dehydrogenase family)
MALKLDGKIAVITGGSSGLGLATARRFVEEGAFVFITGRRQKELDEAVLNIGRNITAVQGDMAVLADIRRLYATVREQKGKIDIVFANAGTGAFGSLGQITEQHFDLQFDLNVKGLLFTVQEALPLLQDGGAVVLNASIVSVTGAAAMSVYSASKAAVRSFARTWSVDLKDRHIRVNAISPGIVPTPGYNTSLGLSSEQVEQYVANAIPSIPLGRAGTPDEIARAVVFLASDDSSYVTGIELFVDGGLTQV